MTIDRPARWAILGPGAISRDFADALTHAQHGELHAVGSRDAARAQGFADEYGVPVAGTYAEVLARKDVDAVYIGAVHTAHVDLARQALEAGKAVLCEKPMALSAQQARDLFELAQARGLPLVEAFKYRFTPFTHTLRGIIESGVLGSLTEVEASFGFAAGQRSGRLFDPDCAGGAIWDVGCYPMSLAVGIAHWAGLDEPEIKTVSGSVDVVDESASVTLALGQGVARLHTSIVDDLTRAVTIRGERGELFTENAWGGRSESASSALLRTVDGREEQITVPTVNPMAAEADATVLALRAGETQVGEMPWNQSITTAGLLEQWRDALSSAAR